MPIDIRSAAADFYDLNPHMPQDVPFYLDRIPSSDALILELGCGTGRVTVPLAAHCRFIQGVDSSPAMLDRARRKLLEAGIQSDHAAVAEADITDLELSRQFDLIIAPFRVLQNLETDDEVRAMLAGIYRHLAPGGTAILNAFNPSLPPEEMRTKWVTDMETPAWEVLIPGGRVTCHDRRPRMDTERLVLYPDLVYRRYENETLAEEVVLHLVMRCWYPESFETLITGKGFQIIEKWGGYAGEEYGRGPELVIQFEKVDLKARFLGKVFERFGRMPAPWEFDPRYHPYSIGWRMGSGEDYKFYFHEWLRDQNYSLEDKARFFLERNPPPAWLLWVAERLFPEETTDDRRPERERLMERKEEMEKLGFTGFDDFEAEFARKDWI